MATYKSKSKVYTRSYKKPSGLSKKLVFVIILILTIAAIPLTIKLGQEYQDARTRADSGKKYASGQIIVKMKEEANDPEYTKDVISRKHRKKVKRRLKKVEIDVVAVTPGKELDAMRELQQDPDVEYAELDYFLQPLFFPNDPEFEQQWNLHNLEWGKPDADIDAPEAWDITQGLTQAGQPIRVAILDTGIDQNHPDLSSKIALNSNFTTASSFDDVNGHGTAVGGVIAAVTNNSKDIAGVCPQCVLLNGKIAGDDGWAQHSDTIEGITWAADNGAKVINISFASSTPPHASLGMQDAINYARSKDALVIAGAGNSGAASQSYPAALPNVVSVASTDDYDQKATSSNYGTWVDIAAPGVGVRSTKNNGTYDNFAGTSIATPMAAGVAALIWAKNPNASVQAVENQLLNSADKIAGTGSLWASGRVNAANAVLAILPTITPTPPQSTTTKPPKKKKKKKKKGKKKKGGLPSNFTYEASYRIA